jgi:O-methyltransferase involved in polyketide biosynthesis
VPDEAIDLRTDVPHSARIYDYLLGGKDNFPADRAAAEAVLEVSPIARTVAVTNRQFMRRVTHHLAEAEGVRQFLDIGTGLPTSPNLHEVAQGIAPESRVVYVDNDPIVLVHARALLTGSPEGRTTYLQADLHEPDTIMTSAEVRDTFDLSRPVAVSLLALLHYVEDDDAVQDLIASFMEPLPKGSMLVLSLACSDGGIDSETADEGVQTFNAHGFNLKPRTLAEIEAFFAGMELLEPGVVMVHRWRPDEAANEYKDVEVGMCGGVARKI